MNADAYDFAQRAHAGQFRGDGVTPYFEHVQSVAMWVAMGRGTRAQINAALLHDVMEDCNVGYGELTQRFGAEVAQLVGEVTFPAGTPNRKAMQIEAVRGMTPGARLIKLADILANLQDLPSSGWDPDRQSRYRAHLQSMRAALAGTNEILERAFDLLIEESLTVSPKGVPEGVAMRPIEGGV